MIEALILLAYLTIGYLVARVLRRWEFDYYEDEFPLLFSTEEERQKQWDSLAGVMVLHALTWPLALPALAAALGKIRVPLDWLSRSTPPARKAPWQ